MLLGAPDVAGASPGTGAVASPGTGAIVPVGTDVAASAGTGAVAAEALSRLFERTCFRLVGDRRALAGELADPRYHRVPDRALARPGRAYGFDGEPGHLMVLAFDDGWCGNGGTGIDPHALTVSLVRLASTHHVAMRLMGTDESGQEQRYLLTRPPPAIPIALLVLLQPAGSMPRDDTLQQATLFTAAMPAAPLPLPPLASPR